MAVTTKQMSLLVGTLGVLSFIFGVIAENKKPASGTPITGKDVICKYPADPTVALGYLSFGFLAASTLAGGLSLFYPYKGKSIPWPALFQSTSFFVFFLIAFGGNNTLFWKDPWCGSGQRLIDIFPRLYALDSDKDCKVSDRWDLGHLANGVRGGTWSWRISPRGRSLRDIDALATLIGDIQLVSTDVDKWSWSGDVSGVFRVRSLAKNIDNILLSNCRVGEHHIWNSWIPRKTNICTWRASLNRLPTRSNLASRGVPLSSSHCPFCMVEEETLVHCIISCPHVLSIWRKIWSWWNLDSPLVFPSFSITDIVIGNVKTSGCSHTNEVLNGPYIVQNGVFGSGETGSPIRIWIQFLRSLMKIYSPLFRGCRSCGCQLTGTVGSQDLLTYLLVSLVLCPRGVSWIPFFGFLPVICRTFF
nr:RNA-directed DNA polymerase, eukaryota, reverse transcriptase zinc-binding domain protein [Tanacetum cinerariifolium]